MHTFEDEGQRLPLRDESGHDHIRLLVDHNGNPKIELINGAGELVWSAPEHRWAKADSSSFKSSIPGSRTTAGSISYAGSVSLHTAECLSFAIVAPHGATALNGWSRVAIATGGCGSIGTTASAARAYTRDFYRRGHDAGTAFGVAWALHPQSGTRQRRVISMTKPLSRLFCTASSRPGCGALLASAGHLRGLVVADRSRSVPPCIYDLTAGRHHSAHQPPAAWASGHIRPVDDSA